MKADRRWWNDGRVDLEYGRAVAVERAREEIAKLEAEDARLERFRVLYEAKLREVKLWLLERNFGGA